MSSGENDRREPAGAGEPEFPSLLPGRLSRRIARLLCDPPESEFTLWRVPSLNAAFAVLSAGLLLVTLWAVWQDHSRDWKRFAAEWRSLREEECRRRLEAEGGRLKGEDLEGKEREIAALEARIAADGGIQQALRDAFRAEGAAVRSENQARIHKAALDARRYAVEEERRRILGDSKGGPEAAARLAALEKGYLEDWAGPQERMDREAEALRAAAKGLRDGVQPALREREALSKRLAALTRTRDILSSELSQLERSLPNAIRNAPFVPPYAPTDQIQKVVLEDLPETLGQVLVPRVDRCKTCHLNIDDPDPALREFTDGRSVHGGRLFRSHPRLDLYAGAASPHPYERFGCTVCHQGDGRSTGFLSAVHTPRRSSPQPEEWKEKYGWREPEHQDFPMLPLDQVTASCAKCHPFEERVPEAERLNSGRELVEMYGCPGCHKIEGIVGSGKVGPSLRSIAAKAVPGFLFRWIEDPPGFRPHTRMPKFLSLSNSRGTRTVLNRKGEGVSMDMARRNEVEAMALAAYLEKRSEPGPESGVRKDPFYEGDPARGKETVKLAGCLGCHSIVREGFAENTFAPDLGSIGSKVRKEWLLDWLVDPQRYDRKARMPRLRIEREERGEEKVADIAAYLMGLRDPGFEGRGAPEPDGTWKGILREIAFELDRRPGGRLLAREKAESLPEEDLLLLVGEKLASSYGCRGCHEGIGEERDGAQFIGPDLSHEGSKDLERFDFGRWGQDRSGEYPIEHSREGWIRAKLTDPRIFDTFPRKAAGEVDGVRFVPTEEIVEKAPGALLRMPLFSFSAGGRRSGVEPLVTFLLSLRETSIPSSRIRRFGPDEEAEEAGRSLIRRLNCRGCHRIGAEPRSVSGEELPSFSFEGTATELLESRMEKETWLGETLRIGRMTIPRGTFLSAVLKDENDPRAEEPFPVSAILMRFWEASKTPPRDRRVRLLGFGEGKVRSYFGGDAESRPKAPPLLRKEGERVNGDWLFEYLLDVQPIRRWLQIRMPSYRLTEGEAALLVRWFKLTAGAAYPPLGLGKDQVKAIGRWFPLPADVPERPLDLKPDASKRLDRWLGVEGRPPYPHEVVRERGSAAEALELAERGREMFQVTFPGDPKAKLRLQCNTCHPAGEKKAAVQDPSSWGPDFAMARKRLRPSWIARWLLDPRAYFPDTKMPNHFASFDDPLEPLQIQRPDFEGEIEALVRFLMLLSELPR